MALDSYERIRIYTTTLELFQTWRDQKKGFV